MRYSKGIIRLSIKKLTATGIFGLRQVAMYVSSGINE